LTIVFSGKTRRLPTEWALLGNDQLCLKILD
jgi:hypothetical protein